MSPIYTRFFLVLQEFRTDQAYKLQGRKVMMTQMEFLGYKEIKSLPQAALVGLFHQEEFVSIPRTCAHEHIPSLK